MPLNFDLPFDQLQTYSGRNPRPTDFDSFWDESLAELARIDPEIERREADFQAPFARCEHLYFRSTGGAKIHAKLLSPARPSEHGGALLHFHGYSGDSGNWTSYLGYAAAGFTVAAMDVRGQGGLSEDVGGVRGTTLRGQIIRGLDSPSPADLLFRHIFLDTAQLARVVQSLPGINPDRLGAYGGSQGGGLTLACAALTPSIRRLAPVFPFLCDYKRVWEMDQAKAAYEELSYYFRMFDPRHKREDEIFERLGYIDVQFLAPRIRGEVMMGVGLMDTICPPSTQFAAYNKITSPKSLAIYPDYGHEGLRSHDDTIYQFLMGLAES
jgi:cephalosporin-C deacetylase